jgi:ankyrin repeat protein
MVVQGGNKAVVQLLAEHEANIAEEDPMRSNALHLAARNGRGAIARQLLSFNSNIINTREGIYFTPLDLTATRGFKGLVQLLISMGTDLRAQDLGGGTALYRAVEEG